MANNPFGPVIPNQNVFLTQGIWNGIVPQGGLKALRSTADWSTGAAFTVDLTLAQQQNLLSNVQTVYVDNSQNDQPVTIIVQGTLQRLTLPGNWQGTLPVLCPNPPVLGVQSSGTGFTVFYWVNAPLPCLTWPGSNATFHFDSGGALIVTDQALDACITDNAVNVQQTPIITSPFAEAVINFSASGDNTIIAAVSAKIIRIYRIMLIAAGATNLTVKSGSTSLTGAMAMAANGGFILDESSYAWFTGGTNENFILNSSAAVVIAGRVYYTVN